MAETYIPVYSKFTSKTSGQGVAEAREIEYGDIRVNEALDNLQAEVDNLKSSGGSGGALTEGSVTTDKIANGAVTLDKLSEDVKDELNKGGGTDVDLSGYYTKEQVDEKVPTKTSQLTNDSGFLTEHQSLDEYAKKSELPSEVTESTVESWGFTKNTGTYTKPEAGIPAKDLDESVRASLEKANSAIQQNDLVEYALKTDVQGIENTANEAKSKAENVIQQLEDKQDKIDDLDEIKAGAALGATAFNSLASYREEVERLLYYAINGSYPEEEEE